MTGHAGFQRAPVDSCVAGRQLPLTTLRTKLADQVWQSRGELSQGSSPIGQPASAAPLEDLLNQQE